MHKIFSKESDILKRYNNSIINAGIEKEIQDFNKKIKKKGLYNGYIQNNINIIRRFVLSNLVPIGFNMELFDDNIIDYLYKIQDYKSSLNILETNTKVMSNGSIIERY